MVKSVYQFCIVFLLLSLGKTTVAQDTTRVVAISTRYMTEQQFDRNGNWQQFDTAINRIEIFQAPFRKYILFQDLGNAGSQNRPLLFDVNQAVGFRHSQNPFELFFLKPAENQYVNTRTPYTDIYYSQGKEQLIFLKLKHAQNILPRWNIGIDYQRLTSQGYLPRTYTSHYNFMAFTAFQSKSRRYTLIANTTWNRGLVEESGGIKSDSLYERLSGNNKVVSPKLENAQTQLRHRSLYVKQYWSFGKAEYQYKNEDTLYDFQAKSHLSYTLHAQELSYNFVNAGAYDSTILPHQYYDVGTKTSDSTYIGSIENKLAFHWFNTKASQLSDSIRLYFGASVNHALIAVGQDAFGRNYHNLVSTVTFERQALKNHTLSYSALGSFAASGYNSGDFKIDANIRYRFPLMDLSANGLVQVFRPDYTYQKFKSNAFIWEHNFDKITINKLGASISTRKWRNNLTLQFNNSAVQNWVYAGVDALPKQNNSLFVVQTFTISKTVQLWKFMLEHELMFQKSYNDIIRVPEAGGMIRYYFASRMFKKLTFQLGFSLFYNTAYYGNSYNPANRMFYLQNSTRIGNYPMIDPFFIGEIKRVAFFVKYEHVNQDWINSGFYYTPHYPVTLRSLRFGVRWRFYN